MSDAICVVWDIDDTLYLERDYVRSGFRAVGDALREHFDADGFGDVAWALFEQGVRGDTFDRAASAIGRPELPVDWMVARYREHEPDIELSPDASSCIDRLSGVPMAAVSDGPWASQHAKAVALGVPRFADPVVLTSALGEGKGKPHPAGFESVVAAVGLSASRYVYVADNPAKDFVAPRQLGWATVRIRRPLGLHVDRPSADDVDAEIESLDDLDATLDRLLRD